MRSLNRSLLTRTPSASKIMARTICFEMGSFYASSSRGSRGSGSCAIGTGGSPIPAIGDRLRSPQPQLRCRSAELRLGPRASSGARTFADRRAGAHRLAADWAVGAVLGGALVIAAFIFWRPETSAPTTDSPIASSTLQNGTGRELEVVAEDLEVPWEIAFLPEGGMLVTERPGYLTVLGKERRRIPVPGVRAGGEGGLLGMALHPDFEKNRRIYLYFTAESGGRAVNRVVRYIFRDNALSEPDIILDGLPGSNFHNGGGGALRGPTPHKHRRRGPS